MAGIQARHLDVNIKINVKAKFQFHIFISRLDFSDILEC